MSVVNWKYLAASRDDVQHMGRSIGDRLAIIESAVLQLTESRGRETPEPNAARLPSDSQIKRTGSPKRRPIHSIQLAVCISCQPVTTIALNKPSDSSPNI